MLWFRSCVAFAAIFAASAAVAEERIEFGGECVPFARRVSGLQIWGDARTWWGQAEDRYTRGRKPRVGAVIAFRATSRLPLGHVAAVSRIVSDRVIMITHSNWSRFGGARGKVERDVTVVDVSPAHDWSAIRVWYRDNQGLGGSTYPIEGFIYGEPADDAPASVRAARPASDLSGPSPDIVGALIDAVAVQ
jgi:surface antigen